MKMTDDNSVLNIECLPASVCSSPSKGGAFSSESEDVEEDWASCADELERGAMSDTSPQNAKTKAAQHSQSQMKAGGIQTRSGLIQQLEREATDNSDLETDLEDRNVLSMYGLDLNTSLTEGNKLCTALPSDTTTVNVDEAVIPLSLAIEIEDGFQNLRNKSYQKAILKNNNRPKSVPDILPETNASKGEYDATNKDAKGRPLEFSRAEISHIDDPESLGIEYPSILVPSSNSSEPPGGNISRSVSFNDRLLETPKRSPSQERSFPGGREQLSCSSPSTPSLTIRGVMKTTQTVQITSKSNSPDVNFERGGSPGEAQRKRSFKNITSSLARRLSFRKQKIAQTQVEDSALDVQLVNGLPCNDGIVSYQGLLRLFECPGCNSLMLPPLLQCIKGHLVCEKCRTNFKMTCPICKQRVTGTTNYMMEQVCQLVKFPCQFGNYGCPDYHPPKQKIDHEHFCVFRPVYCHFASFGCEFVLPLKDMDTHMNACQFKPKNTKAYV